MKRKNYWSLLAIVMAVTMSMGLQSCFIFGGGDDDDDPELSVSKTSISLQANGDGDKDISVTASNTDWTVSVTDGSPWLRVNKNGQLATVSVDSNPTTATRTGKIKIVATAKESLFYEISVSQAGADILVLSGLDAPFDAQAGSIQTAQEFTITCNGAWTLEGKPDWLDISALSGSSTSTIKVWANETNRSTSERSATLTVRTATKSASKTVKQRAGYSSDLEVSPNSIVTLADGFAFDFTFGSKVKYYYVDRYLPTAIDRKTDEEIITEMSSDDSNRDTPSDGYVTSWQKQTPLTEYVICTVGYDQNGNHGALSKTIIKTKSGTNQAIAVISDVQYDDTKWHWTTTVNAYLTRYYMWFNTNSYLYDTTNAAIAWFFKRQMDNNPNDFQPIAQSGDWSRNRNGGTVFDVITWALDVDGSFSGAIDRFTGQINSGSRKLAPKVMSGDDSSKRYKTLIK